MVDEVDRLLDEVRLDDVDAEVHEALGVADVLDVRQRAGLEVVDADHAVPAREQLVAQMRAEEAGAAGDQTGGHCGRIPVELVESALSARLDPFLRDREPPTGQATRST